MVSKPKPSEVVCILMTRIGEKTRDVQSRRGEIRKNVVYTVYECPRKELCKPGGKFSQAKTRDLAMRTLTSSHAYHMETKNTFFRNTKT